MNDMKIFENSGFGAVRVVCGEQYPDGMALEMLRDAGVAVEVIDN